MRKLTDASSTASFTTYHFVQRHQTVFSFSRFDFGLSGTPQTPPSLSFTTKTLKNSGVFFLSSIEKAASNAEFLSVGFPYRGLRLRQPRRLRHQLLQLSLCPAEERRHLRRPDVRFGYQQLLARGVVDISFASILRNGT